MEIIAELEGVGRGAYTGALGYLNRDGSCDFNILIRTITARGPPCRFAPAPESSPTRVPAQELAETRAKAEGLLRALRAADGMSTWINGRPGTVVDCRDRGLHTAMGCSRPCACDGGASGCSTASRPAPRVAGG